VLFWCLWVGLLGGVVCVVVVWGGAHKDWIAFNLGGGGSVAYSQPGTERDYSDGYSQASVAGH